MDIDQKELLLQIAQWNIKEFNNRMVDTWSDENFRINEECYKTICMLEKEYTDNYGELPKWKYIDDVFNAAKQLKEELRLTTTHLKVRGL